jgi:hypothetical protein
MKVLQELKKLIVETQKYKPTKYSGDFDQIAEQIIKSRWNGKFFAAGETPRLNQFWLRDYAFCLKGLIAMDYRKEAEDNLKWALDSYMRVGNITTGISKSDYVFDIPKFSIDSLPFFLYSIKTLGLFELIEENKVFFNSEIKKYFDLVFDKSTNMTRSDKVFSQPKDVMMIKGTSVGNTFMIFTVKLLNELMILDNPFPNIDSLINKHIEVFWDNDHFKNDNTVTPVIESSDSNIWPYWTEIIQDEEMLSKSINWIETKGFLEPFPIKYHINLLKEHEHIVNRLFLPNYQGNSIWSMNPPIFFSLVKRIDKDKAESMINGYKKLVEKWQDYYELIDPTTLKPLKGTWKFESDKGMLWIAMFYGV